jgi:hypothetical protein
MPLKLNFIMPDNNKVCANSFMNIFAVEEWYNIKTSRALLKDLAFNSM